MLGINWPTILFHIFNFALLALLLNWLLYEPINKFIVDRENYYKAIEDETLLNLENSKLVLEENNKKLENVHLEAEKIMEEAVKQSQLQANQEIILAKEEGKKIIEESRVQAQREKEILIRNTKKDLKEVAIEAAAKLSLVNGDVYDDFINHIEEVNND